MTETIFAILVGALCVVGLGVALFLGTLRSARILEQRCVTELQHLKSLLSSRHLIVSHLVDSIPTRLDRLFDRRRLLRRLSRAEKSLQSVDPASPNAEHLHALEGKEQDLIEQVEDLTEALKSIETISQMQAITGCLDGLEKKTNEILDSASMYNAATITYRSFLDSSLIARQRFRCLFEVVNLEPMGSSISGDSGMSSDRVAS